MTPRDPADWSTLRLKDRITPDVRVLFVGINPGVRSAVTGHHFAGFSNRFWKLLFESGLVPEAIGHQDDGRLPEFGYGITNLIARPSPGINDLRPIEYVEGWKILERKIRRYRPRAGGPDRSHALPGDSSPSPLTQAPSEEPSCRAGRPIRADPRRAHFRSAESERPERELHVCGDAGGVQNARDENARSLNLPGSGQELTVYGIRDPGLPSPSCVAHALSAAAEAPCATVRTRSNAERRAPSGESRARIPSASVPSVRRDRPSRPRPPHQQHQRQRAAER